MCVLLNCFLLAGRIDEAEKMLAEAEQIAELVHDKDVAYTINNTKASLYFDLGNCFTLLQLLQWC